MHSNLQIDNFQSFKIINYTKDYTLSKWKYIYLAYIKVLIMWVWDIYIDR